MSLSLDDLISQLEDARRAGHTVVRLVVNGTEHTAEQVWREPRQPCGYSEPESNWRDPDTGKHRTARCEGGRLVVRGNGLGSFTDGGMFITARICPRCKEDAVYIGEDPR